LARRRIKTFVIGMCVSAMVAALATVMLAFIFREDVVRWTRFAQLHSDDAATRRTSLAWIVGRMDDERVVEAVDALLSETQDEALFDELVAALADKGHWSPKFEKPWVRYLIRRSGQVGPSQRAAIAAEFAAMMWDKRPYHDEPRIAEAVERLLRDEDENVRLNALTAAALLPGAERHELIGIVAEDANPTVRQHARIMLALLEGRAPTPEGAPESPPPPPEDADEAVKRLAALEAAAPASLAIELTDDMPPLLRLYAVRASKSAEPSDLLPVFDAALHPMRDLAVVVARERFDHAQRAALALELVRSFDDHWRWSGAMLIGSLPTDRVTPELRKWLDVHTEHADSWVTLQHFQLARLMLGETVEPFDPATLLVQSKMPRTTTTMALLELGRLDGLDWLINPIGEPGVGDAEALRLLLNQARYEPVLRRYLPELPPLWFYAEVDVQRYQVDVIRNWYLLNRSELRFDRATRTFAAGAP